MGPTWKLIVLAVAVGFAAVCSAHGQPVTFAVNCMGLGEISLGQLVRNLHIRSFFQTPFFRARKTPPKPNSAWVGHPLVLFCAEGAFAGTASP